MKITVEERSHDWVAYADGNRKVWECGDTEIQAVGSLMFALHAASLINIEVVCPPPDEDPHVLSVVENHEVDAGIECGIEERESQRWNRGPLV
jgi:hypothetical protein